MKNVTGIDAALETTKSADLPCDLADFCEDNGIIISATSAEIARKIWDAASEDGYLQAEDMLMLFPGRPELHTATRLVTALRLA